MRNKHNHNAEEPFHPSARFHSGKEAETLAECSRSWPSRNPPDANQTGSGRRKAEVSKCSPTEADKTTCLCLTKRPKTTERTTFIVYTLVMKLLLIVVHCDLFHSDDLIVFIEIRVLHPRPSLQRRVVDIPNLIRQERQFDGVKAVRRNRDCQVLPMNPNAISANHY